MCIYIESPYTYIMASLLCLVGYRIIIRYELGKDLINGKTQVKDFNVKLIRIFLFFGSIIHYLIIDLCIHLPAYDG